ERFGFDLAHALACQREAPPDLLERLRLRVREAVAEDDHLPLAIGERRERHREGFASQRVLDGLLRKRIVVGDEVAEDGVLLLSDGLVEARRRAGGRLDLLGLLNGQVRLLGDLVERRLAAELRPEKPLGAVHLLHPLDDVDGHADRPRLVGERARDGLTDPPGRVRGELVAAAPVELLDGADQAERALLDQVEERQALIAIVLGDRDDQPQVRLDHRLLGLHVAALDLLRELDLLGGVQERMPARLAQEELQRVRGGLGRHGDRRRRWRGLFALLLVVDDLDAALVELAVDGLGLEHAQLQRLEHVVELRMPNRSGLLSSLEQLLEVRAREYGVQLDRRHTRPLLVPRTALGPPCRSWPCTRSGVMSSRRMALTGWASPWA